MSAPRFSPAALESLRKRLYEAALRGRVPLTLALEACRALSACASDEDPQRAAAARYIERAQQNGEGAHMDDSGGLRNPRFCCGDRVTHIELPDITGTVTAVKYVPDGQAFYEVDWDSKPDPRGTPYMEMVLALPGAPVPREFR